MSTLYFWGLLISWVIITTVVYKVWLHEEMIDDEEYYEKLMGALACGGVSFVASLLWFVALPLLFLAMGVVKFTKNKKED